MYSIKRPKIKEKGMTNIDMVLKPYYENETIELYSLEFRTYLSY